MNWNSAAEQFVEALSSSDPTPGGGAAAAMTGAMGCALALMAVGTTLKSKNTLPEARTRLEKSLKRLNSFKTELKGYIQKDALAYQSFLTAKKMPKENPDREIAMADSLYFAATVPADAGAAAQHCLREIERAEADIAPIIFSDILCAKHLLKTCIRCSLENIRVNAAYIKNETQLEQLTKQIKNLEKQL